MARPRNIKKTEVKTFSLYSDDLQYIRDKGIPAQQMLALGVLAHKNGYSPLADNSQVDELKQKIKALAHNLDFYIEKTNIIGAIIEKHLNIEVTPDTAKLKILEKKLIELTKKEKILKTNGKQ